ncbi:translation initiation factor IF-2 [Candidatus Roizmanbacteria bacterium CG01_land_8_20_14_3_00_33_9]|uniref:Translation initiation factor IF-2 n=1 Tax=Candidatus Roizmanbacteria bacterium CG01_land_8_20_14_3_00_33_9 TaxID=1974843 RepID=A0A2M7E393_9BACT|nr:MAG: translation initiation factor IF-2 [Candidatus Roizmanbacteria bacterium CG01_land_8_20_14_3_00_33_9]
MIARSPIVAILGHVDHGKTTLLDYLRKSQIAAKEFGGITQKIGGYSVNTGIKDYQTETITFIDTPGHEAFSKLRARGATVADIAILVIDGKDSIMPQTVESIAHIKAANIPFIVTITKSDLPDSNPEKVKRDLLKHDVLTENKGGKVPVVSVSAKTGSGINELLETILLIATDLNLTYDPKNSLQAHIIENKKDRRGIVTSVIVKDGTLKVGDDVYYEDKKTRVKSLINDLGESITQVFPSTPCELLGFEFIPPVGATITGLESASSQTIVDQQTLSESSNFSLESILNTKVEEKKLVVVVKTDNQGSLEAINQILANNPRIKVILAAVGAIHQSDIFLAKASKGIVIGFSIKPDKEVVEISKQEKVIIKTYNIIYELVDELTEVAQLLHIKETKEKNLKGEAKVQMTFIIENEKIYGIKMIKGKLNLDDEIEVYRNNHLFGKTKLISLHTRAKKIQEIRKEQEAGMIFSPPLDICVGDVVKCIL